jgi:hypothetical protein
MQRLGKHVPAATNTQPAMKGLLGNGVLVGSTRGYITRIPGQLTAETRQSKIIEKRWQRDSWQLQQRIGLRVPELVVGR